MKISWLWILVGVLLASTILFDISGYNVPLALLIGDFCSVIGLFIVYVIKKNQTIYVCRRLLEAFFVLFVVATLTFLLLRFIPGGPFDQERPMPAIVKANIQAKYHLNEPLWRQYVIYLNDVAHGRLGESYKYIGRPVEEIVSGTLPVSVQLGCYALLLSYLIGVPLGLFAASKHNTWWDSAAMFLAISGVALPSFLVAPLLILFFSSYLNWLPSALWESPIYYILPVITLGIRPAAFIARLTRSSVLDVIKEDYVRTARAKGLNEKAVMFKHVLKNSLIPVITHSGPLVAAILSGAFVIELIFAVPGIAKHFIESVTNRDYPLVLGVTLLFCFLLVMANLVVDILYSIVDPRIKLS